MKIHIVFGSTGEYSDNRHWPVKAFFDEEKAKQHVLDADRRAKELYAEYLKPEVTGKVPYGANEYDPKMDMDYNGTYYYYETTELDHTSTWHDPREQLPEEDCEVYIACKGYGNTTKAVLGGKYIAKEKIFVDSMGGHFSEAHDFWHVTFPFERKEDKMYFWCIRYDQPVYPDIPWEN